MSLALYLVVVVVVAVVAGLTGVAELRRGVAGRCAAGPGEYLAMARAVAASTLLRPAAAAVLVVTAVWLLGTAAAGVFRLGSSPGVGQVSVPILVGGSALYVLVMVPRPLLGPVVDGVPRPRPEGELGRVRPAGDARPGRGRGRPSRPDFARWERELRDEPEGDGPDPDA